MQIAEVNLGLCTIKDGGPGPTYFLSDFENKPHSIGSQGKSFKRVIYSYFGKEAHCISSMG